MTKIRQISILVWEIFEKNRKALGQTEDQYLGGLLGIEAIPIFKKVDSTNTDPTIIEIAEATERNQDMLDTQPKKKKLSYREKLEVELARIEENEQNAVE